MATCLAVIPPARAQAPPEEYRSIIASAVGEFSEGRWAEASAIFERAHALFPNARTLRGMGMCAFEMRHYPEAIRYLDQSLRSPVRELTRSQRHDTEELLGRARGFVGTFRLLAEPAGAEIRVDGEVPRQGPEGHVVLGVGEHTVRATASGYRPLQRELMVGGGEDITVPLTLLPSGPGDPAGAALGLLLGGAATLLVEPFVIGWWVDRETEISSCANPPEGFMCANANLLAEQRDTAIAMSVGVGVTALVVATTGMILWLSSEPAEAEAVACRTRGVGLRCQF